MVSNEIIGKFNEKWQKIEDIDKSLNILTIFYIEFINNLMENTSDWLIRYFNLITCESIKGLIKNISEHDPNDYDFKNPEFFYKYSVNLDDDLNPLILDFEKPDLKNYSGLSELFAEWVNRGLTVKMLDTLTSYTKIYFKDGKYTYNIVNGKLNKAIKQMTEEERFNKIPELVPYIYNIETSFKDKNVYFSLKISPLLINLNTKKAYYGITANFNFEELEFPKTELKTEIIKILTNTATTYNDSNLPSGSKINETELNKKTEDIFNFHPPTLEG